MTDENLLRAALDDSAEDWEKVQDVCADRNRAMALARMLEENSNEEVEAAVSWAHALAELHPGLTVNLPHARHS
jgi:hypothetical protein